MPTPTAVTIDSEDTLNTAITDANGGALVPTTGTFSGSVTETAAPDTISAAVGNLILDGADNTLTGDGADAALILGANGQVTIENLTVTNTGTAAAISTAAGSVVTFEDDGGEEVTASVISAPITGAGAVHVGVATAPIVEFSAVNTYTGSTVITDGTLELTGTGSIAASSNVSLKGSGAELDVSGVTATMGAPTATINELTGTAGTVNLGAVNLVVNEGAANATFGGVVQGTGSVTLNGADTLTLSGDNTYTGSTIINGHLALSGSGSIEDSSNVSLKASGASFNIAASTGTVDIHELTGVAGSTVALGANTLAIDENSADALFAGVISGTGGIDLSGTHTLTLGAAETYTGATTIEGGADLQLGVNGSIASSSAVTVYGTFDVSQPQTSTGGATSVAVNDLSGDTDTVNTIILGHNTLVVTETQYDVFTGSIVDSATSTTTGGSLTIAAGAGTLELDGTDTYTGSTKIYGALVIDSSGALEDSSNVSLKQAGASLTVNDSADINELTGVAGSTLTLNDDLAVNQTVAASFSGVIGGEGSLTVNGTAAFTLAGANTIGDNLTVNDAGGVTLSAANVVDGVTTVADLATLTVASGGSLTTGELTIASGSTLTVAAGGSLGTITGLTTVDGTLTASAVTTGSIAVTDLNGTDDTAMVNIGANKLVDTTHSEQSFEGTISGTGALQVGTSGGSGELVLDGSNTQAYTGSTIIYSELVVADGSSIENSSNVSLKTSAAVLDVSDASTDGTFTETFLQYNYTDDGSTSLQQETFNGVLVNELTGVAGSSVDLGYNTLIVTETANASFSGVISDNGNGDDDGTYAVGGYDDDTSGVSLVVRGAGTLTLQGANTFHGDTVIKGDLALAAGGSISNSYVADYGVFDITAATGTSTDANGNAVVTIQGLEGGNTNATVLLGSNTLDITGSPYDNNVGTATGYGPAHSGIFEGVISGAGNLELSETSGGDADLILTNANTYTGTTTIGSGAYLELVGSGSIASSSAIIDNGDLAFSEAGVTLSQVISGTGDVDVYQAYDVASGTYSAGSVTITAAETYNGTTEVYAGATLTIGAGGSIANSTVFLSSDADTEFADTTTTPAAGILDVSHASGNVTLAGLGGDTGSSVVLGSNSLILTGEGEDFYGVISGSGGVQISANGGLYLGAAQTYTGSTVVTGFLGLEDDATSLASSNVSLKGTGVFDVSDVDGTVTINELTGQAGTHVYLGDSTLVVTETMAATFSGVIADIGGDDSVAGGGLTVDGTAALTLMGANTYTGETLVNGSLTLGVANAIADSHGVVVDGTLTLAAAGNDLIDLSGSGSVKMVTFGLTDTVTMADAFTGGIHGASVLTVAGVTDAADVLTLSGTSDYSGGTHLTGATLELSSLHAVGAGAITFADATGNTVGAVLQIDNAALTGGGTATESFANAISGLSANDSIDLSGLTYVGSQGSQTVTVATAGQVVITEGNVSVTLNISDATVGEHFYLYEDTHGGTFLSTAATEPSHYHP